MARIRIGQEYKRTCPVELPGPDLDETATIEIVAVFRDQSPDELQTVQEQIRDQVKPMLDLIRNLSKGNGAGVDLEQSRKAVESAGDLEPLLERVLVRVEGLEVENADGSEMSADQVREYCLKKPNFRAAIEAKFTEANKHGAASLGNLLKSAGGGRA